MIKIRLREHELVTIGSKIVSTDYTLPSEIYKLLSAAKPRRIFANVSPFSLTKDDDKGVYHLQAGYYIGADWLVKNGAFVYVEPKINIGRIHHFEKAVEQLGDADPPTQDSSSQAMFYEVDIIKMLTKICEEPEAVKHIDSLLFIDWHSPQIELEQKSDILTPFLIAQFLGVLKNIVKKGLKKSYHQTQENLSGKMKGRLLVARHIQNNVIKNHMIKNLCEYPAFDINIPENQFLKYVLRFCDRYLEGIGSASGSQDMRQLLNFCRAAFEQVSDQIKVKIPKHRRQNAFFKDYQQAIELGECILKRFGYQPSVDEAHQKTPPFWIDMPKLFELYVYTKMLKTHQSTKLIYQFGTYGNVLDFLIADGEHSLIIDAKYKLKYHHSLIHQDIRQVCGYARLNKVRQIAKVSDDQHIRCLIIYPVIDSSKSQLDLSDQTPIHGYYKVFKLGLALPITPKVLPA